VVVGERQRALAAGMDRSDFEALVGMGDERRLEIRALQRLFRKLAPGRLVDGRKPRFLQDAGVHPVAHSHVPVFRCIGDTA
jgi:hypothetical protein